MWCLFISVTFSDDNNTSHSSTESLNTSTKIPFNFILQLGNIKQTMVFFSIFVPAKTSFSHVSPLIQQQQSKHISRFDHGALCCPYVNLCNPGFKINTFCPISTEILGLELVQMPCRTKHL